MSKYPEGNFIVRFLVWILGKLGWWSCSLEQHDAECKRYDDLRVEKESLVERNKELNRRLNKANKTLDTVQATSIEEQMEINRKLELEQDRINAAMQKSEEYYKTVQEALNKALQENGVYKFDDRLAFPGSTSFNGGEYRENDEKYIIVTGRTIMTDEDTSRMKTMPDVRDKYQYAYNHLLQWGLVEKIAKTLVTSGGVAFTIAFNPECTSAEVYYNIRVKKPDNALIIDVNMNK